MKGAITWACLRDGEPLFEDTTPVTEYASLDSIEKEMEVRHAGRRERLTIRITFDPPIVFELFDDQAQGSRK